MDKSDTPEYKNHHTVGDHVWFPMRNPVAGMKNAVPAHGIVERVNHVQNETFYYNVKVINAVVNDDNVIPLKGLASVFDNDCGKKADIVKYINQCEKSGESVKMINVLSYGPAYDLNKESDRVKVCSEYAKLQQNNLSASAQKRMEMLDNMAFQYGLIFSMTNESAYRQPNALVAPRYELVELKNDKTFQNAVLSMMTDTKQDEMSK